MAGELQLALTHELIPANAPLFAADIVAQAAAQGVAIDYSPTTPDYLDSVTASLRSAHVTIEQVPEVLLGFGFVLGECVRAAVGGSWVDADLDIPVALRAGERVIDPIGFAFATLVSGRSYRSFYDAATA